MGESAIYSRRSIRKFRDADVAREDIEEIIRAGSAAPSAKNRQPWKCIVLKNGSKEEFLGFMEKGIEREENSFATLPKSKSGLPDAKNTLRIMREAPVLIVVINTNGKSPFSVLDADERFTEICDSLSIGAFIENMLLQAERMGIGTLWVANTCFAYQELVSYLNVQGQLIGAVALGYAAEQPDRRPRKALDEIVEMRSKTDIEFRKITEFPRGTLAALLADGYSFEPKFERDWHKQWQEFDDFFYDNPHIAEFSGFMTVLEGKPIGFVSWNPTNLPESTEVGHNCILTKYKGNGYGKRQMREAVQRIIAQGAKKIVVYTNEICVPAQHTYESAGFQFVKKSEETFCSEYAGQRIHYEIVTG